MSLDYPISDIDNGEWPFDLPTYKELYSSGMNVDKVIASFFGNSALATFDSRGRMVPRSVNSARRFREAGAIRINATVHREVKYAATEEDVRRGHIVIGVGKPSRDGGKGYEVPIPVFEYLGECEYSGPFYTASGVPHASH